MLLNCVSSKVDNNLPRVVESGGNIESGLEECYGAITSLPTGLQSGVVSVWFAPRGSNYRLGHWSTRACQSAKRT